MEPRPDRGVATGGVLVESDDVFAFASVAAGVGVSVARSGTSTLPSPSAVPSSVSSSEVIEDGAVGEAPSGEIAAPKGLAETETEEVDAVWEDEEPGDGEESAAKSEDAASEMRREARFWLLVNLGGEESVGRWSKG